MDQNSGGRGGFERNGQKAGEKIRKGGGKRKQADQEGKREGEGESNFSNGGKKNAHPPPPPLLQILPFKCCRYLSDILETQNREKFTKVKQDS